NEKKLVWYSFRDKLPQVSPLERHGMSRPPRTDRTTAQQTIVANPKRTAKSKQMVYLPAPPRELDRDVPAPNLFAFAVPKLPPPDALPKPQPKKFVAPREAKRTPATEPAVPDAPKVAPASAKLDLPRPDALPKPQPKRFVAPREARRPPATEPAVPDAPKVAP